MFYFYSGPARTAGQAKSAEEPDGDQSDGQSSDSSVIWHLASRRRIVRHGWSVVGTANLGQSREISSWLDPRFLTNLWFFTQNHSLPRKSGESEARQKVFLFCGGGELTWDLKSSDLRSPRSSASDLTDS